MKWTLIALQAVVMTTYGAASVDTYDIMTTLGFLNEIALDTATFSNFTGGGGGVCFWLRPRESSVMNIAVLYISTLPWPQIRLRHFGYSCEAHVWIFDSSYEFCRIHFVKMGLVCVITLGHFQRNSKAEELCCFLSCYSEEAVEAVCWLWFGAPWRSSPITR